MASIYDLKPKFQALLRPITRLLAKMGVTANQVTIAACAMSIAWGLWIWASGGARLALLLLPAFLFVRMSMNAIDGMLAREHDQKSKLGAILNELTDVIADAAIYLPFAYIAGLPSALVIIVVLLGVISELTGLVGLAIGASRRYDGPFGKSDRALFFGAVALALGIGIEPGSWTGFAFVFAAFIAAFTIANRAGAALKEAGHGNA